MFLKMTKRIIGCIPYKKGERKILINCCVVLLYVVSSLVRAIFLSNLMIEE